MGHDKSTRDDRHARREVRTEALAAKRRRRSAPQQAEPRLQDQANQGAIPSRSWLQLNLDALETAFTELSKSEQTPTEVLRVALQMLDLVLFDLFMERDSTPAPLLQLVGALRDKAEGRRTLLLDGESSEGVRGRYSRWAYRRIQGFAAGIVEAWVRSTEEIARTDLGRKLGARKAQPIRASREVARILVASGFVMEGRGHSHQFGVEDPVERLAHTVKSWRNKAALGKAEFQSDYDAFATCSSFVFDDEWHLKHLARFIQPSFRCDSMDGDEAIGLA